MKSSDPKPDPDEIREAKRLQAERVAAREARGRARIEQRDAARARLAASPGRRIGTGRPYSRRQLARMVEDESQPNDQNA